MSPDPMKRLQHRLLTLAGVYAVLAVYLWVFFAVGPTYAQPSGCRLDPSGTLVCKGSSAATSVPPRATTVPRGTPRPTVMRPTQPPPPPTPVGYQSFWKYCVANAGSPSGYYHLYLGCPPLGTGNCRIARTVVASNCNVAPTGITVKPLPCPSVGLSAGVVGCIIGWVRQAQATIPPVPIAYKPYPRGLVTDPMEFTAPSLIVQNWACTSPQVDNWNPHGWNYDEDYRHLYFCLRWRQIAWPDPSPDPAPAWIRYIWDERSWGQPQEEATRQSVTQHTYVTSSAQKPENGPANLPAYQVQAHSYWVIDWKETWEHAYRWTECRRTGNQEDTCEGQSGYAAQRHLDWRAEGDGGTADLRGYGAPHFYADNTLVKTPDGRVMNVLPVPVIEVQGVIGNP